MKRMLYIAAVLMLMIIIPFPVSADGSSDELYEASGAQYLSSGELLEENGISFSDPESILSLSPSKLWDTVWDMAADKLSGPLTLFMSLLSVIILAAVSGGLGDMVSKSSTAAVFEMICTLVCVTIISGPVSGVLENVSDSLSEGAGFMTGFVPVFAGVAAAGGYITSASGYNVIVLTAADAAIQIADRIFMPILSMCMCIAIVDSVCRPVSLEGLLNGIKKIVTWGLGFIMTVFTGLLSIQSIVGSSADSLSAKTAKYVISNCIPVVGGAVSDAYSTVKGSLSLLRNGIGGVGIAALAFMLLPSLISIVMYKLSLSAACIAAEILGTSGISKLFRNINTVLSAAIGVVVCFDLMFIISTAVVMIICT
ncbi:MAG: hypothetical protein ACI4I9_02385 [Porcipelethomonas sp.]